MSTGDDITKAAVDARTEAYQDGYQAGEAWVHEQNTGYGDTYLQYQFFLGLAQAIANHGREVSGLSFGKGNDPQRKAQKA